MKKIISFDIVIFITLCVVFYSAYALLLQDNCLHSSISSIITRTHTLEPEEHLLVLGLLPIYIATVIFGSALLGLYIGSCVRHLISRAKKRLDNYKATKKSPQY